MSSRPWEYSIVVVKLWGKQISGPIAALIALGLTLAAAYYADDPKASSQILKISAWAMWIAAAALVFIAQYEAWRIERDRHETEVAKNSKPELRGEAFNFSDCDETYTSNDGTITMDIRFDLIICNHRPMETNIQGFEVDGSEVLPAIHISEFSLRTPPPLPDGIQVFEQGASRYVLVAARAKIYGREGLAETVNLERLKLYVVDGFGQPHIIKMRPGEKLKFPTFPVLESRLGLSV